MAAALEAALQNLLSPPILFFALGLLAALLRSDLEIPPVIGKALSLYLMAAIGFKGGIELAKSAWTFEMAGVAIVAILLSLLMPVLAFALLRRLAGLDTVNAAAVGATYGSVSVVTFVTAVALLTATDVPFGGYLVAVLALMETPALLTGIVLARRAATTGAPRTAPLPRAVVHEAFTSGSVLLLLGALVIGWATGARGAEMVGGVFIGAFQGILALFLLEMGLLVARRLRDSRRLGKRLIAFGLVMPFLGATIGLAAARALGLGVGDGTLLAVLAASASYIAVPAALRVALPEADPGIYVTLSLAVTFPLNIVVGIPLYHEAAALLLT